MVNAPEIEALIVQTSLPRVRAITFYLPQFHPIPENDKWWGKGFTEWINVVKARPNFKGHEQPHLPADLGFYDLRVKETRLEQAELARRYGIHGFCFYYYWFAGKRLLYRPLEEILQSGEPDFPFCICWANENWTRAWDGRSGEVLISQHHSEEDNRNFIRSLFPFFLDRRYIHVNGRPLLLIYRIDIIPDVRRAVELWRGECAMAGINNPYLVAVQSFGIGDPMPYGFDAAVEFPPHGTNYDWNCNEKYRDRLLNPNFSGHIIDIDRFIDIANQRELPPYRLFRGVMPRWDNTARRQDTSLIFVNTSPERYESWLARTVEQTCRHLHGDERLVFINAWNEWAEGCHLEPDQKYGHAYLEATHRALCGQGDVVALAASSTLESVDTVSTSLTTGTMEPTPNEPDLEQQSISDLPSGVKTGFILGVVRWLYRRLPLARTAKIELAHRAYTRFPRFFQNASSYRRWREIQESTVQVFHATLATPMSEETPEAARAIVFPEVDAPKVSIVIPVQGKIAYTLHCLRSIQHSQTRASYEVIVLDDCSTDRTPELLELVCGVITIRNETNLGFLRSCNKAAARARGDYLLFLNNDTEVLPGWLDELFDTFATHPEAGLVGSKLVYPDGRLREAGGLIWRDGSVTNYGRDNDANRPEYNFPREVDYCSGVSLMVPRRLFEGLGGFDERFAPACYGDTDLAFSVRQVGYKVLLQPFSRVIHFEGVTSGADVGKGTQSCQRINQDQFVAKWRDVLTSHGTRDDEPWLARERGVRRRALIVDVKTPMPDKDSGSIDMLQYIRMLRELGFKVVFCPHDLHHAGRYTEALQRLGVECLYQPFIVSLNIHLKKHGTYYDLVMLCRADFAAKHIDSVRRHCCHAKVIFNTVDLHYLREERQAKIEQSTRISYQAKRTKALEHSVMKRSDATIVISQSEYEILHQEWPELKVAVIPYVRELYGCAIHFLARRDILFIGNFQHSPNIDAVQYFVTSIWPLIRRKVPEMNFFIIGSGVPPEISSLARVTGVFVKGFVKDIAPIFNHCRLSVAPLRFGAGIKGKIGTSLSYGVPCIATTIAAEGMGLVDRRDVMIANDAEEFAAAVVEAYQNEALWNDLSKHGLEFMEQNFSYARGLERLGKLIDEICPAPEQLRKSAK